MAEKDVTKTTEKKAAMTKTEEMQAKIAAAKKAKAAAEAEADEKPAAKKPAAKPAVKKEAAEKPVEKKPAAKKPAAEEPAEDKTPAEKGSGSAAGLRIGAAVLWVAAIVFEVLAVLVLAEKIAVSFLPTLTFIIVLLVADLICVCIGSVLWKKSNRIDPASEANKVKFWLWNNMGLIVTAVAFIPFVIISLTNKNADKKTKTVATIVALVALLIGGLVGYDWNPISAEGKEDAIATYTDAVYWTPFGTVFHIDNECSHINKKDNIQSGSVEEAIEANKTRVCKDCAKRYDLDTGDDAEKTDVSGNAENTDTENENTEGLIENTEAEEQEDAEDTDIEAEDEMNEAA